MKNKDDLIRLSAEIVEINYNNGSITQDEFDWLLNEAKRIISEM